MFQKKRRENDNWETLFSMHEDDKKDYGSFFLNRVSTTAENEKKALDSGSVSEEKKKTAADYNSAIENTVTKEAFAELQAQVLRQQYPLCDFKFDITAYF